MYYKVKIKKLPEAQQGRTVKTGQQLNGALAIQPTAMGGADIDQYMGKKPVEIQKSLKRVPREEANLEAEGGETAYGDINGDGFTEHYNIEGPRHSSGGVPLNLPDDTFIFSDTRSMMIKDPAMLSRFGKGSKDGKKSKGYTPAQLAKQYDINKYRKILQDPDSDVIAKKTAELMIRNYNMKLGALALAQEAKKGFPQGIPAVAQPYMEANGIEEEAIMPTYQPQMQQGNQEMPDDGTAPDYPAEDENIADNSGMNQMPDMDAMMMEQAMGQQPMAQYGYQIPSYMAYGGYMPEAQEGIIINPYEGGRTKAGTTTPTGKSNKYSTRDQDIKDYLKQWEGVIPGISRMSEGKAQAAIYDWNLANNPEAIQAMWKEFGLTKKGKDNPKLLKYSKDASGVLDEETLKNPETLKALKDAYVDNYFGARQIAPKAAPAPEEGVNQFKETKKVLRCECVDSSGKTYDPGKNEAGECNECEGTDRAQLVDVEEEPMAPVVTVPEWTTPDLANYYGALKDKASLRKYYPWAAPVDMEEYQGVYLDPTRELAANSEQANILTQGLAQFVGPQAMSSRSSQIQGQGAKQAADTLSRYNNANVQIANQVGQGNLSIRNQERAANQAIAKQLYDQTTLTNATYDRDKRLADSIKRQAFQTGWKNASDIALLNATAQQYDIDPATGTVVFTGGKELEPQINQTFDKLLKSYVAQGFAPKDAIAAAKIAMGEGSNYMGPDIDAIMDNYKNGGMYVMGANIFPFMFY